jgi:hypothetical protein
MYKITFYDGEMSLASLQPFPNPVTENLILSPFGGLYVMPLSDIFKGTRTPWEIWPGATNFQLEHRNYTRLSPPAPGNGDTIFDLVPASSGETRYWKFSIPQIGERKALTLSFEGSLQYSASGFFIKFNENVCVPFLTELCDHMKGARFQRMPDTANKFWIDLPAEAMRYPISIGTTTKKSS